MRAQICLHVLMISDAFENETAKKVKLQNILTQLRKCVDHPYLFDGEWGSVLPPHRSVNSLSLKAQQGVPSTEVCLSLRCALDRGVPLSKVCHSCLWLQ